MTAVLRMVNEANEGSITHKKAQLDQLLTTMYDGLCEFLKQAGPLVCDLDRSGFDWTGYPLEVIRMARKVGMGAMLPELVKVRKDLFERGRECPIAVQRQIIDDENVRAIDLARPSIDNVNLLKFSGLTTKQAAIVLSEDGVRSPEQQFVEWRNSHVAVPSITHERIVIKRNKAVLHGAFTAAELMQLAKGLGKTDGK